MDEFTHSYEDVNGVRLHYVIGGQGDPVVLLHGWPQKWYEWRHLMPDLAKNYTVIAPDLRGLGESSVPEKGYDCKTVAEDIHMLCKKLGHNRVAVVAHDIGMAVGYAWAASYPDEVSKLVVPDAVPDEELEVAVKAYSRPGRLKAGFAYYRAMAESASQNAEFMKIKLKMPVLAVGGETCLGDLPGQQMKLVADNVTTVSLTECGHWVISEQPAAFLKELLAFLSG